MPDEFKILFDCKAVDEMVKILIDLVEDAETNEWMHS